MVHKHKQTDQLPNTVRRHAHIIIPSSSGNSSSRSLVAIGVEAKSRRE